MRSARSSAMVRLAFVMASVLISIPANAATVNVDRFHDGSPVPNYAVILKQVASLGLTFSSPAPAGGPTAGTFVNE